MLSKHEVSFLAQGDSIAGHWCAFFLCINSRAPLAQGSSTDSPEAPWHVSLGTIQLAGPLLCLPCKDDDDFCRQDVKFTASLSKIPEGSQNGIVMKYFLHPPGLDETCLMGAAVFCVKVFAHHSMHVEILIFSSISLALSLHTKIISMFEASCHLSLLIALDSLTA